MTTQDINRYHIKTPNRQTDFYSLCAVVGLLLSDDRKQLEKFYELATHSNDGSSFVYYLLDKSERQRKYYREKALRKVQ